MVTAAIELRHEDGGSVLSKTNYPKECPVFDANGFVVQGMNVREGEIEVAYPEEMRDLQGTPIDQPFAQYLKASQFGPHYYNPLTPAAEEMLAIARERSGS